jgi:hypothetical protein
MSFRHGESSRNSTARHLKYSFPIVRETWSEVLPQQAVVKQR